MPQLSRSVGVRTAFPGALSQWDDYPYHVAWTFVERDGNKIKLPINPGTGKAASASNPETWRPLRQAQKYRNGQGVGLVLGLGTDGAPRCGLDLDACFDELGVIKPWAKRSLDILDSYAELSPSGQGIKSVFTCSKADYEKAVALCGKGVVGSKKLGTSWKAKKTDEDIKAPGAEMYFGGRYFAITGNDYGGKPLRSVPFADIKAVFDQFAVDFVREAQTAAERQYTVGGRNDRTNSGEAYNACLAAHRAGIEQHEFFDWLEEQLTPEGDPRYDVDPGYWDKPRAQEGDQFTRDFTQAGLQYEREKKALLDAFEIEDDEEDGLTNAAPVPAVVGKKEPRKFSIAWFNKYHCAVRFKGKFRIANIEEDGGYTFSTRADFVGFFENSPPVEIGEQGKVITSGEHWLRAPNRRDASRVVFKPGLPDGHGVLNLFRGYGVEPAPGDCSLILDHILTICCKGNHAYNTYTLDWLADMVQKPGRKPGVAMALIGKKGSGKDTVGEYLAVALGLSYTKISNSEQITGKFNSALSKALFCHCEEAFFGGDPRQVDTLKHLITSQTLRLEYKGVDTDQIENFTRFFLTSNNARPFHNTADERRFFALEVSDARIGDFAYFKRIYAERDNGGAAAFLHFLMTRDLSDFIVQRYPRTDALQRVTKHSMENHEQWWLETLMRGTLPGERDEFESDEVALWERGGELVWPLDWLREDCRRWIFKQPHGKRQISEHEFTPWMREISGAFDAKVPSKLISTRPRGLRLHDLATSRSIFAQKMKTEFEWPTADDDDLL